ncbi:MAG: hypothetical protein V2A34_15830, partial [Lentisphaerota bacterium]
MWLGAAVLPDESATAKNPAVYRDFKVDTVIDGLNAPDGLVLHPKTGEIYMSEEDRAVILRLKEGKKEEVITRQTP